LVLAVRKMRQQTCKAQMVLTLYLAQLLPLVVVLAVQIITTRHEKMATMAAQVVVAMLRQMLLVQVRHFKAMTVALAVLTVRHIRTVAAVVVLVR
jgi:hypothetical protein